MENTDSPREMLNTWHNNLDPAQERWLMVKALNGSGLHSHAETVRMGDQHHATGNAVASNLNMGRDLIVKLCRKLKSMASFDPNFTQDLDYIIDQLNPSKFSERLHACLFNQDKVKELMLLINELIVCLKRLAEKLDQMGECLCTVPQGMSSDQHHASFDPNTPLDARELDHISDHLCGPEFISLSQSLRKGTPLEYVAMQYKENADAPREMLDTWHSNQDPAKERRLLVKALNENWQCSLAETVRMGRWHALQPSSAPNISCPRKRTHTQTLAGHETNTPETRQPSSAPNISCPRKRTLTQTLARHETNTLEARQPSSAAAYPSRPKVRSVANPLQQPDIAPMGITQQTSYEITEIKLRDISNKLGREWRTVGTYLGFGNSQIEVMQEEYRVVKECIFQMLLQWRNSNGVEATKEKLKKALRRSYRADLTGFIDESDD